MTRPISVAASSTNTERSRVGCGSDLLDQVALQPRGHRLRLPHGLQEREPLEHKGHRQDDVADDDVRRRLTAADFAAATSRLAAKAMRTVVRLADAPGDCASRPSSS